MKTTKAFFVSVLQKMGEPKNIRILMFLLPLVVGAATGNLNDVGGNMGGCTGG